MQRAIRVVRSRAAEWGVDPNTIGASGFSAGGELAELVALRHDLGKPDAADPIDRFSSRPDFQVLIYPGKSDLIQPVAGSPPAFMAELHMYAKTGHGFGLRPERAGQSHQEWPLQLVSFLHHNGFIK